MLATRGTVPLSRRSSSACVFGQSPDVGSLQRSPLAASFFSNKTYFIFEFRRPISTALPGGFDHLAAASHARACRVECVGASGQEQF
jgi:hypothetical protein